jgi:hypothetical protein
MGHDASGHRAYAFSAKSFWCISSEFLSSAERVSSSTAFLRSSSVSSCTEGQPMVDEEDIKQSRDLSVFLERESHQRRERSATKMKAYLLMTLMEKTSVTDFVYKVICVRWGGGYGRNAVGEVGRCWLTSAGVDCESHGGDW